MDNPTNEPFSLECQLRRYYGWKRANSIMTALNSLPRQVEAFNRELHQQDMPIEQIKTYIAELTRNNL